MPQSTITQQAMLAQPKAPPASVGSPNAYSILAGTESGRVGLPYDTGSTMLNPKSGGFDSGGTSSAPGALGAITGAAATTGGANVGGVVSQGEATDYAIDIPEARDMQAEQENEFIDAYKEGYTTQSGWEMDPATGEMVMGEGGKEKGANTMGAARSAKRDDRRDDRSDRQEARQELKADLEEEYGKTMNKGQARRKARRHSRKAKRATRKGQKASRKAAWQTFKGEKKLLQQEQAADLEKYID